MSNETIMKICVATEFQSSKIEKLMLNVDEDHQKLST